MNASAYNPEHNKFKESSPMPAIGRERRWKKTHGGLQEYKNTVPHSYDPNFDLLSKSFDGSKIGAAKRSSIIDMEAS